ncbi:MAG: phytanoyl-CoA dioxygenase family protein [Lentisphaeria bacterium]|nr:phytanoyl-CoA dioxygenase family protein [Lentisphaeria bacterium]
MKLSDTQIREFEGNGFLIIEDLLTPEEVTKYRKVVTALDQQVEHHLGDPIRGHERQAGNPLELRNAVAWSDEILELMTHPVGFEIIQQLMNQHICLTTSHVFIRPPSPKGTGEEFKQIDWHRDGPAYGYAENKQEIPWLYTKIGYFLSDTTIPDCGALRVIPGSHRYIGNPPQKPGHWEPYGAIDVKLKPGSAVIFENRLMHAVGPNFSAVNRENIYMGYCWQHLRPIDYIQQDEELLKKCDPLQQKLLGNVDSALDFYLPQ